MSQSSVGTETANDSNENPMPDSRPSKTMGAESGPDEASPKNASSSAAEVLATPSELLDTAAVAGAADSGRAGNPEIFPYGPNVAPSPWKKDAAEGKAEKQGPR